MSESAKKNYTLNKITTIQIKLGSKCNLHCQYCHNAYKEIKFNPDVLTFIKQLPQLKKIRFSGGEPLLYKNIIQYFINALKDNNIKISLITNGTLLNNETVDWINNNNIVVGVSFDGFTNLRGAIPDFTQIAKIKNFSGISAVVTSKFDYEQYWQDIAKLCKLTNKNIVSCPNFMHQTINSPNYNLIADDTASKYINFILSELAFEYKLYQNGTDIKILPILHRIIIDVNKALAIKQLHGVRCCNEKYIGLSIDGKIYLCNYELEQVGDIYNGVNWDKIDSFIPIKCKQCEYWMLCRNYCTANITDNECKIQKAILKEALHLPIFYNVFYDALQYL